jgi:hypothetical protein
MKRVRIQRLTLTAGGWEPARAERVIRRAAQLAGQQLGTGDVVAPAGKLVVSIPAGPGSGEDDTARRIALALAARLR